MYNDENVHSPACDVTRDKFADVIASESERVKPMISEQLLRNYILGVGDINEIINIYCKAFNVDKTRDVRLVILKPFKANDFEDFFFIRNTAQQYMGKENLLLCTIVNDFVLMATTMLNREELRNILDKISGTVRSCYDYSIMAVYSKITSVADMPSAYERLKVCIGYSFYSDGNRTLYENDIMMSGGECALRPDYNAIENAVRSGDTEKIKLLLAEFFGSLTEAIPTPAVAKTYCLELYVCMIRCCGIDKIERYMKGIVYIQEAKYIKDIQSFIEERGMEIAAVNAPEKQKIYSSLIRDTINIIDENIENENLSLRWLAGTILYTNVDYLGKLFKKETGKNFSHYVMEKRMEMAKGLILEGKKDRIYEIAENVGYGNNSQYFSQVFKKYTGVSPLEYKEFAKLARQNNSAANNS